MLSTDGGVLMPKIGSLGLFEILIILVVVLMIFGPKRLPDMARGLGQSIREFRKSVRDVQKDIQSDKEAEAVQAKTTEPNEQQSES